MSVPVQKFGNLPQPQVGSGLLPGFESWEDPDGKALRLYQAGGGVTAPISRNSVWAGFSTEAREKKLSGACSISLIVDAHGMPQDVLVMHPLGYGLDEEAVASVNQYRFDPAMKDGQPVPVMVIIEVNFRLY
jgi:TonB family protein